MAGRIGGCNGTARSGAGPMDRRGAARPSTAANAMPRHGPRGLVIPPVTAGGAGKSIFRVVFVDENDTAPLPPLSWSAQARCRSPGVESLARKPVSVVLALALWATPPALAAQSVDFGDDSSEYPRDGECDDRRFRGPAMATALDWENVGRDAMDCRSAMETGRLSLWVFAEAVARTRCAAITFGDDSSAYAGDGECDDPRFEGLGLDGIMNPEDMGRDATDCARLCGFGLLGLRDD